jgi:hypothetical protein
MQPIDECSVAEPSGHMFLESGYDTAMCCVSKDLGLSSLVPDVPIIPEKEAKNRQ